MNKGLKAVWTYKEFNEGTGQHDAHRKLVDVAFLNGFDYECVLSDNGHLFTVPFSELSFSRNENIHLGEHFKFPHK